MFDPLDGCEEFDSFVLDAAFEPTPAPQVEAHLRHCERCRRAMSAYRNCADLLRDTFPATPDRDESPESYGQKHSSRGFRISALLILAASLLIVGSLSLTFFKTSSEAPEGEQLASTPTTEANANIMPDTEGQDPHILTSAPPPSSLSGEISSSGAIGKNQTIRVFGRVLDKDMKKPISNAVVHFALSMRLEPPHLFTTTTDEDGRFEGVSQAPTEEELVTSLLRQSSGDYSYAVSVHSQDHALHRHFVERKEAGELTRELDLKNIFLAPGATVRGSVVGKNGTSPIGNATVFVSDSAQATFFPANSWESGSVGDSGKFELDHRLAPYPRPYILFAVSEAGLGWTTANVLSGMSTLDNIVIPIRSSGPLRVTVVDESGRRLPHASVRAEPRFFPFSPSFPKASPRHTLFLGHREDIRDVFTAHTRDEGTAVFDRLPVDESGHGTYDLVAYSEGFSQNWDDGVRVEIGKGANVQIVLHAPRSCRVFGRVLRPDQTPIPGATVRCLSAQEATADSEGYYSMEGVSPNSGYRIFTAHASGYPNRRFSVTLSLTEDVEQDFLLEPAAPISGRVVDQYGQPVTGAAPRLSRKGLTLSPDQSIVPEDGRFVFSLATTGTWNLQVMYPPGEGAFGRVEPLLVHGGDQNIELVLPRLKQGQIRLTADIRDAVTWDLLDPTASMLIRGESRHTVEYADAKPVEREAGRILGDGLHPGPWYLWVQVDDRPWAWKRIDVSPTDVAVETTLEMPGWGQLRGRVILADEAVSPEGFFIYTKTDGVPSTPGGTEWDSQRRPDQWTQAGPNGEFAFERLKPGRTTITANAVGWLGETTVTVPSENEVHAELRLRRGAIIRFETSSAAPDCVAEFYLSEDGVTWDRIHRLGGIEGKTATHRETVLPGRYHWRVRFDADNLFGSQRVAAKTQEGVVEVTGIETTTVLIPVELDEE